MLLSNDTIGSGVFMADLDEPDYCHASNTSLFELHLLRVSLKLDLSESHWVLNSCHRLLMVDYDGYRSQQMIM